MGYGKSCCKSKMLCPVSLGFSIGFVCGLFMLIFAWVAAFWGHGADLVTQYGSFYPGYEPSVKGGIIGLFWGILEGFIFGFLVALFYDLFSCCCRSRCCKSTDGSCGCGTNNTPRNV